MDAYASWGVHDGANPQLGLDGGVQDCFLLLQVENEPQLGQGQAGRPSQTEQHVVEVNGIATQTPVMGGTWEKEGMEVMRDKVRVSKRSDTEPPPLVTNNQNQQFQPILFLS